MTFLMCVNDALASIVHFTSLFFFSIYVINFTISAKFGINLRKKKKKILIKIEFILHF
jgi:hypothetical protein